MLASINPLGERARNQRWSVTAVAYGLGSTTGGALFGAALGSIGGLSRHRLPASATVAIAVVLCATAAMVDAGSATTRRWLPSPRRQVDERWLGRYRGWVYGLGFGFQLGAGVVTIVSSATVYLCFALAALTQSAIAGGLVGAAFGFARAAPLAGVGRATAPDALRRTHRLLDAAYPTVRRATIAASMTGALVATVALQRGWG
jgi:sulfite exporter TauE/SafE